MYYIIPWMGYWDTLQGYPPALSLPVPIYTPGPGCSKGG